MDDIIHPQYYLKQIIDIVGLGLVSLLNKCLQSGFIPDRLKMAGVTLELMKPSLNASILANIRTVSVLPFISKIMGEKKCFFSHFYLIITSMRHFFNHCIVLKWPL